MEELATSEPTTISETGRIGVEQINPKSTPDEASMNDGDDTVSASPTPTTSGNTLVNHADEEYGPHPGVLNEDVLESVFKHLINRSSSSRGQKRLDKIDILKDVKNIRLVCKTWKKAVTLLYRRAQGPTRFTWGGRMMPFLEVMKNSDLIPVQNYIFTADYLRNDVDLVLLKEFLITCGSDIVSLYLSSYSYVEYFDVTELGDLKLPKLKKLEFHHQGPGIGIGAFLGILLNSAEILEEFKFRFGYYPPPTAAVTVIAMNQFGRIICRRLPTTAKILHLSNIRLEEKSFAALAATGVKLEEFQLDAFCFPGNELAIRKFMESQTNTLKTLLIKGERISESTEFEFPGLNELLCLEMNGIQLKPFSFTKAFPKLQKLDVEGWDQESSLLVELLSYDLKVAPSVKEVIIPVSWNNDGLPKTISDHFPNITTLRISPTTYSCCSQEITGETLQEVFIHFTNIEQLYINMVVLNADSLFSGVSKASCKRIWEESNFAEVNLVNEQSMPSILNLTRVIA